MLNQQTVEKLNAMKLYGMAEAFHTQLETTDAAQWPGYRVYQQKIDENNKILELWVRRKRGNRKLVLNCSNTFMY